MAKTFSLVAPFQPTGDQPQAIAALQRGLAQGLPAQTLLGVTGSGKTFTMANVVAAVNRPTLVISHNKTLAAQLAAEFQEFFPHNAVHYFVSYYDYYQPEAYVPQKDLYIEKESEINEEIDRLRNAATHALLTRRDVLIVASVSCIYGLGNPQKYQQVSIPLEVGNSYPRTAFLRQLTLALYQRNDYDFQRATFRVRGEIIDIFPAYAETALRLVFDDAKLASLRVIDPLTGAVVEKLKQTTLYPGRQFVTIEEQLPKIISTIRQEMRERVAWYKQHDRPLEAERLEQRTTFDLEMMETTGYCTGIENYSRYFDFRNSGQPPATLLDYFPKDYLLFIDESHVTLPQIRAMYAGDRSRKTTLVDYGFRLPSALDNRPLQYDEFSQRVGQRIYVSATPADFELQESKQVVEQLIRPTGLLDPDVAVRPLKHQVDDLVEEIKATTKKGQRVLVTTLTKRMAEDLKDYLEEMKIKVQYLHSEVETFERLEILRDLRLGKYDVVVGINLLREGLDLPEVSLVAILDADKEGFLRSETSLMQVMGRAARHLEGRVIMYADRMTNSMLRAIDETKRRRKIQATYNQAHGITPASITRAIRDEHLKGMKKPDQDLPRVPSDIPPDELRYLIRQLKEKMELAASNLEFEKAALLRDQLAEAEKQLPTPSRTGGLGGRGRGKVIKRQLPGRRRR